MTVSSTTNRISYAGDGTTKDFTYPFKIFAETDLVVILRDADGNETTLTLNTDYTVSGVGNESGGTVSLTTAPASGETLVIIRQLPLTQETDYVENDPFPAESHEEALDRLTMIAQQLQEQIDRAPKLAESSSLSNITFPEGANKFIKWNSDGTDLEASSYESQPSTLSYTTSDKLKMIRVSRDGQNIEPGIVWADLYAFGAAGDGTTDDSTALSNAISYFGSNEGVIVLSGNHRIASDVTVPSNITLWFLPPGKLNVDSGVTVTLNCKIHAGIYHIFDGSGDYDGTPICECVYPQWFGAKADGDNDDTTAIQKAIDFAYSPAFLPVTFPSGVYKVTAPLKFKSGTVLQGTGLMDYPRIYFYGNDGENCFEPAFDGVSKLIIKGLRIEDKRDTVTGGDGINLNRCVNGIFIENCFISGFYNGINATAPSGYSCDDICIRDCWLGGYHNYGIVIERLDNNGEISYIMSDITAESPANGVINLNSIDYHNCTLLIKNIKCEIQKNIPAIYLTTAPAVYIHNVNVIYSDSSYGPVIKCDDRYARLHLTNIVRESSGPLVEDVANSYILNDQCLNMLVWGWGSIRIGKHYFREEAVYHKGIYFAELLTNKDGIPGSSSGLLLQGDGTYTPLVIVDDGSVYWAFRYTKNDGSSTLCGIKRTGSIQFQGMWGAIKTFNDGDSTPSVADGFIFKTNNSSPTTITNFDNGTAGQQITVIFGDSNTTIDFTGTNLKGNNGADWSPSEGDHMTCVYDGTNWYCTISDNTA